jgi:glutamine synthetase
VNQPSAAAVFATIEREAVRFVNLQFVDILGAVKSVTVPVHRFRHCIEHGEWFDGSSLEGFARVSESDRYLLPDLATFAVVPWERGDNTTARVICNVATPDGEPFQGDSRTVLAQAIQDAAEMGLSYVAGPELEFFLFKTESDGHPLPTPHDTAGYFDLSTDLAYQVRKEMVNALEDIGIVVENSHHEVATGQHEIDFVSREALRSADDTVTFKYTVRAVAQAHGLRASFLPKPIYGMNGSGMHVHQALLDRESGQNLFYDAEDPYRLSRLARHFIAGQLAHARGMCAILAPLVNSYKRLVPGFEAPVYVSWARINRSALMRVPATSRGDAEATRVELRCPDPSCNPYLAFAVMLRAGLDGIEQELPLMEPVEENLSGFEPALLAEYNVRTLPASLEEALQALRGDDVICDALGPQVLERFLEAKEIEWEEYRKQVTPWEIERYLPLY